MLSRGLAAARRVSPRHASSLWTAAVGAHKKPRFPKDPILGGSLQRLSGSFVLRRGQPSLQSATWQNLLEREPTAATAAVGLLQANVPLGAYRFASSASSGPRGSPRGPPRAPLGRLAVDEVRHIIAVASGKGGVGKSTTAVNLAVALVRECGLQVGLLDADVYGPSIPRLMNLHGKPQVNADKKMVPMENYGVRCMSMGFLMDHGAPAVWRGPMVMSALEQLVRGVTWGRLDVLVIDMPPGTGDAQISITQRLPLAGAVIVSTPQDIALIDARRGANMFRKVDVPILGLVENMSYFKCENCGHRAEIFGHGGARKTAQEMDMEFLGEVPLNAIIRETSDDGRPITAVASDSLEAQTYGSIAKRIAEKLREPDEEATKMAPRIVVE